MHMIDSKNKEDKTSSATPAKDSDPSQVLQTLKKNTPAYIFYTDIQTLLKDASMNDFLWVFQGQNEKIKNLNKDGICYALTVDWLALCIQGEPFKITTKFKGVDIFKQYNQLQLEYQDHLKKNISHFENIKNLKMYIDKENLELEIFNKSIHDIEARIKGSASLSQTTSKELRTQISFLYERLSHKKMDEQQNNLISFCETLTKLLAQKQNLLNQTQAQYDTQYNAAKERIRNIHSYYYNLKKVKLPENFNHAVLLIDESLNSNPDTIQFQYNMHYFQSKFSKEGIYHVGITFKTKDKTSSYGHVIAVYITKSSIYLLDANSGGFEYKDYKGDMEIFWEFFINYFSALQRYSKSIGYIVEGDTLTSWTK